MAAKMCPVCCTATPQLRRSPASCNVAHDDASQRACNECWEFHLSLQVEEKDPNEVKCIFHQDKPGCISKEELTSLARKGTLTRYEAKLAEAKGFLCQARCPESKEAPVDADKESATDVESKETPTNTKPKYVRQPYNRKEDGRVFTCKFCAFKTCTDCDRPEHDDESCDEYQVRVVNAPQHLRDEAAMATAFKHCPNCRSFWEWDPEQARGCPYTHCKACKFRFCGDCLLPWAGKDSAYLLGREAHAQGCYYERKGKESSTYGLPRKWPQTAAERARAAEKARKQQSVKAAKAAKAAEKASVKKKAGGDSGTKEGKRTASAGAASKVEGSRKKARYA